MTYLHKKVFRIVNFFVSSLFLLKKLCYFLLHDGALLSLQKLDDSYDPLDKGKAILRLHEAEKEGKVLTGLLYVNPDAKDHTEILNIADTPLNHLSEKELCPGSNSLASINSSLH